jgi:hypothetical protein
VNTAFDLGEKTDRAVDALGQFTQGQVLEFAQVVNKDREGFNLCIFIVSTAVKFLFIFHEKLHSKISRVKLHDEKPLPRKERLRFRRLN